MAFVNRKSSLDPSTLDETRNRSWESSILCYCEVTNVIMTWYYDSLELQYPIYQFQWSDVIILLFCINGSRDTLFTYGSFTYNFIHSTFKEDKSLTLNWNGLLNLRNQCNFYTFKQYLKKYQQSKLQNCLRQKRPNSSSSFWNIISPYVPDISN